MAERGEEDEAGSLNEKEKEGGIKKERNEKREKER